MKIKNPNDFFNDLIDNHKPKKPTKLKKAISNITFEFNKKIDSLFNEIEKLNEKLNICCPQCKSHDFDEKRESNGVFGPGHHARYICKVCNKCGCNFD